MTDKKKNDNTISPVTAGVAGAVIGASVAIAGAVALKDDKTKKKVTDTIKTLKDKGADYVEDAQRGADEKKADLNKAVEDTSEKIQAKTA